MFKLQSLDSSNLFNAIQSMAFEGNPGTGDRVDWIESKFCAFCYKIEWWDGDGQTQNAKKSEDVKRFYTLTQRHLNIPEPLKNEMVDRCNMSTAQSVRMDPCEMCLAIVRSFNELYHEMKCLELKLEFKMMSLLDIMREGGKLGPRKALLKKILGADRFRELVTSRKNWGRCCSTSIQKRFPKVKLKRLVSINEPVRENPEMPVESCQTWLISLAMVALLLIDTTTDVSRHDNADDLELDDGARDQIRFEGESDNDNCMDFDDNISYSSNVPVESFQAAGEQVKVEVELNRTQISDTVKPRAIPLRDEDTLIVPTKERDVVDLPVERTINSDAIPAAAAEVLPACKGYGLRKPSLSPKKRPVSDSDSESELSDNDGDGEFEDPNSPSSDGGSSINDNERLADKPREAKPVRTSTKIKRSSMSTSSAVSEDVLECCLEGCPFKTKIKGRHAAHQHLHRPGSYPCKSCKKQEASPWLLALHEALEHSKKGAKKMKKEPYKCPRCTFETKFQIGYATHFAVEHLEIKGLKYFTSRSDSISCTICKLRVPFPKRHFRLVHKTEGVDPDKILTCPEENCDAVFISGPGLERHRREYHKVADELVPDDTDESWWKMNFCKSCDEHFTTEKALAIHKSYHNEWTCKFCPEKFAFATKLAEHELKSHAGSDEGGSKQRSCSRCFWRRRVIASRGKATTPYLKHFLSTHLNLETSRYPCQRCELGFYTPRQLRRHSLICTGSDQVFKCDKCPKWYKENVKLLSHKRAVHKDFSRDESAKPGDFQCDQCGDKFEYEEDLAVHKVVRCKRFLSRRKTERICEICGRKLPTEGHLAVHMKSHDSKNRRQFTCEICGKNFKDNGTLKAHQEHHKDPAEWKLSCEVCSKKCVSKQKLQEHMRTHSKEKPFVCQVCGGKYAHNHNLRNHIKSQHKEVYVHQRKYTKSGESVSSRKGKKLGARISITKRKDEGDSDSSD